MNSKYEENNIAQQDGPFGKVYRIIERSKLCEPSANKIP